jgi:putative ABC transport system ATP-binding protein
MKPTGPAIQALGLSKRYGAGHAAMVALHEVTIRIPAGEFWAITGPSGSGKTTLLGLLGGMIAPTEGEVRLAGQTITHLRDHHRALLRRNVVGVVFQEFALVPGMSLIENILLPWVPQGGAEESDRRRIEGLLGRFGMGRYRGTRVERLSAGERQRGAIIRALAADPPILLLDEPTASLDTANVGLLMTLLLGLRDEGKTLVATTHDLRLAEDDRVDRVLRLVDGQLEA